MTGRILVVDDQPHSYERILKYLSAENRITLISDPREALVKAITDQVLAAMK